MPQTEKFFSKVFIKILQKKSSFLHLINYTDYFFFLNQQLIRKKNYIILYYHQ